MDGDILNNLLRTFGFFLDNIIYGLIPTIYKLFIYLSNVDIISGSTEIERLISRIYVLLGIFMLFKVSFSLIQYLVDPGAFSDKSKGFGKLITNTLVVLVLLVSIPSIFSFAMDFQRAVIQSDAIGRLVLGYTASSSTGDGELLPITANNEGTTSTSVTANDAETMAKDLQFTMYGAFYSLNTDIDKFSVCGEDTIFGSTAMATNEECLNTLNTAIADYDDTSSRGVTLYDFFKTRDDNGQINDARNFSSFDSMLWWTEDGKYVINYLPIVSALAGIYVIFLLITFSIDIAVRAIKLAFLQMVAPIAVVSYIDPKESFSNSKLGNWAKECGKTYFSLFLRLATLFLVMLLISVLSSTILADGSELAGQIDDTGYNIWIYLFLIIGAFMFAKQVPNMIESIFGIKSSGELSLNPFKNEGMAALTGGFVGAGVGGIASGIASASVAKINGQNRVLAGLSGFSKGAVGGAVSGRKWNGKGVGSLVGSGLNVSGNIARYQSAKAGTKFPDRMGGIAREAIGAPQKADLIQSRIDSASSYTKYFDNVDNGITSKLAKMSKGKMAGYDSTTDNWIDSDALTRYNQIAQYKELKRQLEMAQARGDYSTVNAIKEGGYSGSFVDGNGHEIAFSTTARFDDIEDSNKELMYSMINNGQITRDDDIIRIEANLDAMKRVGKENAKAEEFAGVSDSSYSTFKSMKDASKAVETAKTRTEVSDATENAKVTKKAVEANRTFDFLTKK